MDTDQARFTSFGLMDNHIGPHKCRRCGKTWVTGHVACGPCSKEMKYERSNYYFLRSVEIQTLDMGVQAWA